jgi:hypothetical protein
MNTLIRLGLFSVILLFSNTTLAFNPTLKTTKVPYEVQVADSNIENEAEYLGELSGDPHMYEFAIGAKTNLVLRVSQLNSDTTIPFSLIAIKENNQNAGVTEVGRLKSSDVVWDINRNSTLGLTFLNSQTLEAEINPGIYRVEVSTPDNLGRYMLTIGAVAVNSGYFSTLYDIRLIQKAFGKSIFSLLGSSYVYYPLGITTLLFIFYFTWRKRDLISRKNA